MKFDSTKFDKVNSNKDNYITYHLNWVKIMADE